MGLHLGNNNNRILVVDDESDIVDVIRFCLQMYGYKVCTYTDPLAALDHFKSNSKNHHMVISDIRMPAMNGYEFVKEVKKINPEVKVVLMSAFEMENKEFSSELPPDVKVEDSIKKPFSPNTLRNIVLQHSAK